MTSEDKNALDQSLEEVSRFFTEKETCEAFQETVRVLSLDDQQFKNEFSGSDPNSVS